MKFRNLSLMTLNLLLSLNVMAVDPISEIPETGDGTGGSGEDSTLCGNNYIQSLTFRNGRYYRLTQSDTCVAPAGNLAQRFLVTGSSLGYDDIESCVFDIGQFEECVKVEIPKTFFNPYKLLVDITAAYQYQILNEVSGKRLKFLSQNLCVPGSSYACGNFGKIEE